MACSRLVRVMVALGTWWLLPGAPGLAQPLLADRVVVALGSEDSALFVHPAIAQSHFRFIVAMLARSARVPIGFEEVAQEPEKYEGNLAVVRKQDRTSLLGLTVGRALDRLVEADPRYAWREQDGVLLIRPVAAWDDPGHFLNQLEDPIEAKRQRPIDIVKTLYERRGLRVIWAAGGIIGEPRDVQQDLDKRISVTLPVSTTLDALNAIVKAHGRLGWLVEYARGPAELQNSCVRVITFDGKFGGAGPVACPAGY